MNTQSENHDLDPHFAQKTLHDFNNQIFRISILAESLGQKKQAGHVSDEAINVLVQKMQQAVVEAAESGKDLANIVNRLSAPQS